jgi:hypothetical protein
MMRMRFRCRCFQRHEAQASLEKISLTCHICGKAWPLRWSEPVLRDNVLDVCPLCGDTHFYIQRDFNPNLGLVIAVAGCVFAFVLGLVYDFRWLFAALVVLALVDGFLYWRLPDIAKCYLCKSEFRDYAPNPRHGRYDLALADAVEIQRAADLRALRE